MWRTTGPLLEPVDRQVFPYDVRAAPSALRAVAEWDAAEGAELYVVLGAPSGREFHSEPSTSGVACVEPVPGELVDGAWNVMVHARRAVDVSFTVTVHRVGGDAAFVPREHGVVPPATADPDDEGEKVPCAA